MSLIEDKYKKVSELFKSITFLRAELLKLGYDFNTLTVFKQITKTEDLPDKLGGLNIGIIDDIKHLKQYAKVVDDLIEKRTDKNNPTIMGIPQNILVKEFYRDLQTLKQSDNVVEIKIQGEGMYQHGMCGCFSTIPYKCNYCHSCGAKIKWID